MDFNIEVRNFGKIKDANVKIAPFTIISGTNSSGKSFLSRALYTFFSTINKDYVTVETIKLSETIENFLNASYFLINSPSQKVTDMFKEVAESIKDLKEVIYTEFGNNSLFEQRIRNLIIDEKLNAFEKLLIEISKEVANTKKYSEFYTTVNQVISQTKELKNLIKDPYKILNDKLKDEFENNIIENFQIKSLSDLKNFNDTSEHPSLFKIKEMGDISIYKDKISFQLKPDMINELQKLRNVVFIESPIYWKLRKPLLEIRKRAEMYAYFNRRKSIDLTGVPKYFYDLVDLIEQDTKLDKVENKFAEKILSDINSTLTGELAITQNGEIVFKDKGCEKDINLNLTATGITNLGIIALLIQRNIISKGSFVFIDEPEVNLHPAWQKTMIETLYELSKNGINVVVATHSIDMVKYIENIMDKLDDKQVNRHFAINRLSSDGISIIEKDDPRKSLDEIKIDLGTPFYNMVLENEW